MLGAFKFQGDVFEVGIISFVIVLINYVALQTFSDKDEA